MNSVIAALTLVASVGRLPTMSRTVCSSVLNCIFSSVLSIVYQSVVEEDGEDTAMIRGAQACFLCVIVLFALGFLGAIFRLGNAPSERGKCGFSEEQIRELRLAEDEEQQGAEKLGNDAGKAEIGGKVSREIDRTGSESCEGALLLERAEEGSETAETQK